MQWFDLADRFLDFFESERNSWPRQMAYLAAHKKPTSYFVEEIEKSEEDDP